MDEEEKKETKVTWGTYEGFVFGLGFGLGLIVVGIGAFFIFTILAGTIFGSIFPTF